MTLTQFKLLNFIKTYFATSGGSPTYQQIKQFLGVSSNQTVSDQITALINEGYLSKTHGKQQGLELTDKGRGAILADYNSFSPPTVSVYPAYIAGWQSATSVSQTDNPASPVANFNITITERNPNVPYSLDN